VATTGPGVPEVFEAVLGAALAAGDEPVDELRAGQYWTVVQTPRGAGMASSLRSEAHLHGARPIAGAGTLHRRSAAALAALLRSDSPPEASIGLAAANALLNCRARGLVELKALEVLRRRGAGRRVAMIGHFPFADELRASCERLWVFERGVGRRDGDLDEGEIAEQLPAADVVAVTATTLLNGTLPSVLAAVRGDAFLMMLGPSTPLTPALFDLGFDLLCGTVVEDPGAVVRAVEQGAVTSQITGVRRVSLWRESS
jgi:uncharacterized protein (DUF4213/DUF364 family)